MHSSNLESLFQIVEVSFLVELIVLHLALLIVFIAWLAKHVIHELTGLRAEIPRWRSEVPTITATEDPKVIIPARSP